VLNNLDKNAHIQTYRPKSEEPKSVADTKDCYFYLSVDQIGY
jgi:hypothetical protein